jgi:hypothetical protein
MTVKINNEPKKVIPETNQNWVAEVEQAAVRLDHSPQRARNDGVKALPGDRVQLSELRGQPVYAVRAPEQPADVDAGVPAQLEINEASFTINYMVRPNIRGSNGTLSTTTDGTVQTDNYNSAAGFDFDGSSYPYSVNPSNFDIQELVVTTAGDIDVEFDTVNGTVTVPLAGGVGSFDKLTAQSVTFKDPRATDSRIGGLVVGE